MNNAIAFRSDQHSPFLVLQPVVQHPLTMSHVSFASATVKKAHRE